jgi:plastocyanin
MRIRTIDTAGIITTVAGNGEYGFGVDGSVSTEIPLGQVQDIAIDASGNLFFGDYYNGRIRKIVDARVPTVAVAAVANPNPATSATATLNVLGADDEGEAALTYTWTTTGTPPAAVVFSANGTNAAKSTTATFSQTGSYDFLCTIRDADGFTVTSAVAVMVTNVLPIAPTVAVAAASTPNPTTGATVVLSVLGADDEGEAALTYTWMTTGTPPAEVAFGTNGTNAAKSTTATFTQTGSYGFLCTIADMDGLTVTSAVTVTVTSILPDMIALSLSYDDYSATLNWAYSFGNYYPSSNTIDIQRKGVGDTYFMPLASYSDYDCSYQDYTLNRTGGTIYRVRIVDGMSYAPISAWSNEVSIPPPPPPTVPAAPSDLQVYASTSRSVTLHWRDNANNEYGYFIT